MKKRRWVIKVGSQVICAGGPLLIRAWMNQVAELRKVHKIEVIWVTSGAIAAASDRTNFNGKKRTLPEKQALSAIGQPIIMDLYNVALGVTGQLGAQVLLTAGDMKDRARRRNLVNTLEKLLEWQAVPILNENDAVATEEIQFGDNDSLSSQIARMMKAERLILLTDVEGLYDSDPKSNPNAKLVSYRKSVLNSDLERLKSNSTSERGTGGIYSKLLAAKDAAKSGIITHLVRGDSPRCLLLLAEGHAIGTRIGGKP